MVISVENVLSVVAVQYHTMHTPLYTPPLYATLLHSMSLYACHSTQLLSTTLHSTLLVVIS